MTTPIPYYGSTTGPQIGDRIRLNLTGGVSSAQSQRYVAYSGQTRFSFGDGDVGRVNQLLLPASPMIEVEMDAAPGIYLEVWPQYFEKLIGATAMASGPSAQLTKSCTWSYTGQLGVDVPPAKSNAVCVCLMQVLMTAGCRCGATTPYAPPKTW